MIEHGGDQEYLKGDLMSGTKVRVAVCLLVALTLVSCATGQNRSSVDEAALRAAAGASGEWLTVGRDYAETHYSPLQQIDTTTVARLGLAWSYGTHSLRGLEATPLVS